MKRIKNFSLLSMIAVFGFMLAACEPDRPADDTVVDRQQAGPEESAFLSSDLRGMSVENWQGENLGSVDDVAIDMQTGDVLYVLVSEGGILGAGGDLRAVPAGAFTVVFEDDGAWDQTQPGVQPGQPGTQPGETPPGQTPPGQTEPGTQPGQEVEPGETQPGQTQPEQPQTQPGQTAQQRTQTGVAQMDRGPWSPDRDRVLILDVAQDRWTEAPTFERDQLRDTDQTRHQETYEFFGIQWQADRGQAVGRIEFVSEIEGMNLMGQAQEESIGSVDDIIVDLDAESAPFALVSTGTLGMGEQYLIPLQELTFDREQDQLTYAGDEAALQQAQQFQRDRWADVRQQPGTNPWRFEGNGMEQERQQQQPGQQQDGDGF